MAPETQSHRPSRAPGAAPPSPRRAEEDAVLRVGDRMTQREFHRRYEKVTDKTKWELIGGVVYMASPLYIPHGDVHLHLATVLGVFKAYTPGTRAHDNTTTKLGNDSEVQPDLVLRLEPSYGGRSHAKTNEDGEETFVEGPPELVIEVAHSSRSIDTHLKRKDYLAAGVEEYVVALVAEERLVAWNLIEDVELPLDEDGIWRSRRFPGLWIAPTAVFADDTARSLEVVQQGLSSEEHKRFVTELRQLGGDTTTAAP